jgi:hypothetical protein
MVRFLKEGVEKIITDFPQLLAQLGKVRIEYRQTEIE